MWATSTPRSTSCCGKGRINQDKANRLKALVTGVAGQGRGLRRRRLRHRGRLRGDRRQAAGVRGGRGGRPGARDPRHQHLLAVGHRDGRRSCKHPERVVGFHFFNPVAILPLLEIVRGEQTDDASLATAFGVAKKLKKTAVLVKDAPAFVVNRILTRFMGEIQNVIDEGTPVEVAEKAVEPLGPADVPAGAAGAGRPGDRPARLGDPQPRLPGPLHGLREPGRASSRRASAASTSTTPASRSWTRRSPRCSSRATPS